MLSFFCYVFKDALRRLRLGCHRLGRGCGAPLGAVVGNADVCIVKETSFLLVVGRFGGYAMARCVFHTTDHRVHLLDEIIPLLLLVLLLLLLLLLLVLRLSSLREDGCRGVCVFVFSSSTGSAANQRLQKASS